MNNKYPVINEGFQLHITASECSLFYMIKDKGNKESLGLKSFNQWKIHPLIGKYLLYCDGYKSHEEIVRIINAPFSIVLDRGIEYLISETKAISFKEEQEYCGERLFVTGSFDSYNPLHISLEITDYCNFRCEHCYVSASPDKLSKREYKQCIELLDKLYENGVKVIEITGGECTTHPEFLDILKYASEKFNLVAVITNGYILGKNKDMAKQIGELDNVAVQVSIDGLEAYHDKFRCKKGAFKHAIQAIKNLKEYNTIVRVATTVTQDNIDEIKDVFKVCKKLEIDSFATTTVSSFGRGSCNGCNNKEKELRDRLMNELEEYKDDDLFKANYLTIESMIENKEINCGAGWRSFAINGSSGDVRICLFLNDTGCIGNVDSDIYKEVFSKHKLDVFKYSPSPSKALDTCKDCDFKERCNGCIAKALEVYENHNRDCKWVKKYNIM